MTRLNFTEDKYEKRWLGTLPYSVALELQHQVVEQTHKNPRLMTLLGMEHPSVITLGKSANPQEELKVSIDSLESLNIQCYKTDRGGQATLHSPGQLVIYPILKLSEHNLTVKDYLCLLQKTTIAFFDRFKISCTAKNESPGVYTDKGKIAFFGIRIRRGVAFHGLSINVSNQTEDFSFIRSCGFQSETFDRMSHHGVNVPLGELHHVWSDIFLQNVTK